MAEYRGADPVLDLVRHLSERRSGLAYPLFYKDVDVYFDEIHEDAAFHLQLETEYERNYRVTRVVPSSEKQNLDFKDSSGTNNPVHPDRPDDNDFKETEKTYPRAESETTKSCEFCQSGSLGCPNCDREAIVTCPSCYSHRGGDCDHKDCAGQGKITCPECSGTCDCSRCNGNGKEQCSECSGSGDCSACSGSGRDPCSVCNTTGEVTRTDRVDEQCTRCGGSGTMGDQSCGECGGDGAVTTTIERTETCRNCDGRGYEKCSVCGRSGDCIECRGSGKVDCKRCNGTGICQKCSGSGIVTCPDCSGSGRCQFCKGSGTKPCPTCGKQKEVTCPVCEGENQLLLYTEDRFAYEHTTDTETVVPSVFDAESLDFESTASIEIPELISDDVKNGLGLLNDNLKATLGDAQTESDGLLRTSENREFSSTGARSDSVVQQRLLDTLEDTIRSNWQRRSSDSYRADYKLSFNDSERKTQRDDLYRQSLFREWLFELTPLSFTDLRIGETEQRLHSVGTREDYDIELPSFRPSIPKVASLVAALIAATVAVFYSPLLNTDPAVFIVAEQALPAYILASGIGVISLAVYCGLVYRDLQAERPDTIVIISDRDALSTTFFSLLGHSVAYTGRGTIHDEIYTKLSQHLFKDLKLGASLSYMIEFEDEGKTRIVCLSSSSARSPANDVEQLLECCDGVIGVVGNNSDSDVWDEYLQTFEEVDTAEIRMVVDPSVSTDGHDYPCYELDLNGLRQQYLSGEETVEEDVVTPVVGTK